MLEHGADASAREAMRDLPAVAEDAPAIDAARLMSDWEMAVEILLDAPSSGLFPVIGLAAVLGAAYRTPLAAVVFGKRPPRSRAGQIFHSGPYSFYFS